MKCPYQTKVTRKSESTKDKYYAEEKTEFGECLKSECPFYYTFASWKDNIKEHCSREERIMRV